MIVSFDEKPINKKQERELIDNSTDRKKLQQELIARNFGLVLKTAHKYKKFVNFDDLVQEGAKGLAIAAERYDITRENRFNSYAIWYIRKYMLEFLNKEIKQHTISDDGKSQVISMNAPISGDSGNGAIEDIMKVEHTADEPTVSIEHVELSKVLNHALKILSEDEYYIINSRLMSPNKKLTFKEVGQKLGYSISNVKSIETKALKKIKSHLSGFGISSVSDVISA